MGIEREIKLALPRDQVDAALRLFETRAGVPGRAIRLENVRLLHECDEAGVSTALSEAAANLIPLFRTDFTRTLWTLEVDGAQVEAAIDQGEINADVNGQTRRTPICEIELELKAGDEAVLHTLAAELATALPGLAPDDISKAQRGYKLREG